MEYKNFENMVINIMSYIKKYPRCIIVQKDNPIKLMIGYSNKKGNVSWEISLKNFKNSLNLIPKDKRDLIKRAFQTAEGKENLIKSFYIIREYK